MLSMPQVSSLRESIDKFGYQPNMVQRCPRQGASLNCSPAGRLAIAADLPIG